MNIIETGQLLTMASGFDRFIVVDQITTTAWQLALADIALQDAKDALIGHYIGPASKEPLRVTHILDAVRFATRRTPRQIAEDVRSARARGLIERSWPESDPLPDDVMTELAEARDRDRGRAGDLTPITGQQAEYGLKLKTGAA